MRSISTHPSASLNCTPRAMALCAMLNDYKRRNPSATFKQMARMCRLSESSTRRYYYGLHEVNAGKCYGQVRRGACVSI